MSKVTLLGLTQHTIAIQTVNGEQQVHLAPGQSAACFLLDGFSGDEAHEALRRMESVANITPDQVRQLEEYTAPLRGEMAQTEGPPVEGEQLTPPTYPDNAQPLPSQDAYQAPQPEPTPAAAPAEEMPAPEASSDSTEYERGF